MTFTCGGEQGTLLLTQFLSKTHFHIKRAAARAAACGGGTRHARIMSLTLMKLLLLLHAAHSQEERTANCDEDVSLPCPGAAATQFSSVTWYKLHNGKKEGLIMMRQGRQQPLVYNSSPPVEFGEEHSLKLFNVTPEDSGSYECAVNAKIGGRNLNIRVELLVNVCATQGTTVTPTTQSEQLLQDGAEELPLVWSLGGWGVLGLIKILFSVITIQVLKAVCSSRRRRGLRQDRR